MQRDLHDGTRIHLSPAPDPVAQTEQDGGAVDDDGPVKRVRRHLRHGRPEREEHAEEGVRDC